LDVGYNAMLAVYKDTRDPKFYPPMLLQRKVKLGHLGRKTGIGWYRYDDNGKKMGPAYRKERKFPQPYQILKKS